MLKISDFGLAKKLEKGQDIYTMKRNKTIPIRWAAIESFTRGNLPLRYFFYVIKTRNLYR
jgi:hypothetical protein